ncbi:ABC transporter permease [Nocardia rhizosphaerae]|uniref:ABC transporter permease n=1 Tax=Nocardia rhizosphaerae TaxID=1691571 RepID=A0ABV8LDR1_9NOCA
MGTLMRFTLRRERWIAPWWLAGMGALMALQAVSSQNFYDTPAKLAQLRVTMGGNAAAVAMGGPTRLLDTIGGEVVFEIFAYLAITVALMNMFVIGRNTRADEQSGRAELVRAARVGRRAPLLAALGAALVIDAAAAVVVAAAAALSGLPGPGSVLLGVAIGGVGITFAAATAVAAQVFENPRAVYGAVTLLVAAAYVARAVGDVGPQALSWTSPIGWGQRTYPYVTDRWWPVVIFAVVTCALTVTAFLLAERRDFGAGLLRPRTGRTGASRLLTTPLGLTWRLQRASIAAWATGVLAVGVAYGSFADSIEQFLRDYPEIAAYLGGDTSEAVNSYLALTLSILALPTAAFGVTVVQRARAEELSGRAALVLTRPVSRARWLGAYLVVAMLGTALVLIAGGLGEGIAYALTAHDPGQVPRMVVSAVAYLPAVWVVVAVATAFFGLLPNLAAPAAWLYFGYVAVVTMFADAFDLPAWLAAASPLRHTALVPQTAPEPLMLAALVVASGLLAGAGLLGVRHRDIAG